MTGKGIKIFFFLARLDSIDRYSETIRDVANLSMCSIISVVGMVLLYLYITR